LHYGKVTSNNRLKFSKRSLLPEQKGNNELPLQIERKDYQLIVTQKEMLLVRQRPFFVRFQAKSQALRDWFFFWDVNTAAVFQ
jgi:hypothetical protein